MSKIAISGAATGTATFTIESPATSTNRTLTIPDATGTIDRLNRAGNVLQVVSATFGTLAATTSTSYTDTGLSASITPTSASNKVLVIASMYWQGFVTTGNARDAGGAFRLQKDSNNIWNGTDVNAYVDGGVGATLAFNILNVWSLNYLDSPNTTSATTYKVQFNAVSGSTFRINPGGSNAPSIITLMEIAA